MAEKGESNPLVFHVQLPSAQLLPCARVSTVRSIPIGCQPRIAMSTNGPKPETDPDPVIDERESEINPRPIHVRAPLGASISLRFDPADTQLLRKASRITGQTQSEFIRNAVRQRATTILQQSRSMGDATTDKPEPIDVSAQGPIYELDSIIGSIEAIPGTSLDFEEEIAEAMEEQAIRRVHGMGFPPSS